MSEPERHGGGAEAQRRCRRPRRSRGRSRRRRTGPCRGPTARTAARPGARPASRRAGRRRWAARRGPGRPGSAIGSASTSRGRPAGWQVVVVVHASTFSLFERVVWAAIQIAKPTRTPMPTIQANMPSLTGSEAAHAEAAVLGGLLEGLQVGDHVALLVGRQVAVGEDRHLLRAGQHRLVDVAGARRRGSAGRSRPRGMAPPAPAKLWQAVQLVRKIWPPRTIAASRSSSESPSML